MATSSSINVSLPPEWDRFVQDRVATGRYQTASDVVREGLRLLDIEERNRESEFAVLKTRLKSAAAEAERGELFDPAELTAEIDRRKRALAGQE